MRVCSGHSRWILRIGSVLLVGLLLATAAALWLCMGLPSLGHLEDTVQSPSTTIFDRHGRILYEILDPLAGRHQPVPIGDIPLTLRQATVATEDASFYTNPGVDVRAIVRAAWINFRGGEILSGGSTITQQVARNLLLSPEERGERTLVRKLRESILAYRLATTFTKDHILELYLNQTYYGHLSYGVEAAARGYFGRSVQELNIAQCALLAGLPQAPALYDPLTYPQAALARREVVLELMTRNAFIDEQQAAAAAKEPLDLASAAFPIRAPHFVMYIWEQLRELLGEEAILTRGLRVYTSLDIDLQERSQALAASHLQSLNAPFAGGPGHDVSNAAVIALDPTDGSILVMLGSADYFDASIDGAVNVCLMPRQPGSSIKPLTYALALSQGFTPASMLLDVPRAFITHQGDAYRPVNYDGTYRGPVSLRQALGSSLNIPAVSVLAQVGVSELVSFAQRVGLTSLAQADRYGLALTLGGGEVRLIELTAAFASFANGGLLSTPSGLIRVEDSGGRLLWSRPSPPTIRVMDERVSYLITHILSDDLARLPAFGEHSALSLSRPAAAKTGTTSDWRDNWTVGYTPDLVVGVWVGNSDNTPMRDVSGIAGAAPIWRDVMEEALKGEARQDFLMPEGMVQVAVCAVSGQLPGTRCARIRSEIFLSGTEPHTQCTVHRLLPFDKRTGRPARPDTPSSDLIQKVCAVLPSEAAEWIRDDQNATGTCYATEDEWQPAAAASALVPQLILTSPEPNQVFRLSPFLPSTSQQIEIRALPIGLGVPLQVTILVDEMPIVTLSDPPFSVLWVLQPGQHRVVAQARDGTGQSWASQEIQITVQP